MAQPVDHAAIGNYLKRGINLERDAFLRRSDGAFDEWAAMSSSGKRIIYSWWVYFAWKRLMRRQVVPSATTFATVFKQKGLTLKIDGSEVRRQCTVSRVPLLARGHTQPPGWLTCGRAGPLVQTGQRPDAHRLPDHGATQAAEATHQEGGKEGAARSAQPVSGVRRPRPPHLWAHGRGGQETGGEAGAGGGQRGGRVTRRWYAHPRTLPYTMKQRRRPEQYAGGMWPRHSYGKADKASVQRGRRLPAGVQPDLCHHDQKRVQPPDRPAARPV
jgi:hypothetical protein